MGFSSQEYRPKEVARRWKIHPIWRGIGCALILIIPIMAWLGAQILLPQVPNMRVLQEADQTITFPRSGIPDLDKYIIKVNQYAQKNGLTLGQLYLTLALIILGFGVLSFLYAIVYRIAGPARYGPFDVPPDKV